MSDGGRYDLERIFAGVDVASPSTIYFGEFKISKSFRVPVGDMVLYQAPDPSHGIPITLTYIKGMNVIVESFEELGEQIYVWDI